MTIDLKINGPIRCLTISKPSAPHWLIHAPGQATIRFTTHDTSRWLTIDTSELATEKGSSKRTMVTLTEAEARSLLEQLRIIYG